MKESNNSFEIPVMGIDGTNELKLYDILWGKSYVSEYSMRIAVPYLRRIKSWMALPLNERINFMNMRRQNKAYNKIITQHAHKRGYFINGRKVFKIICDLSPLDKI